VIAAVSTSGSTAMMPKKRIVEIGGFVLGAARDISRRMGHREA
jgi:DNA-binding IclR family transcriptional regulator